MDVLLLIAIFILGFVTMFVGAISGGVGLITRPVLIFLKIPADIVVGTSRVAGVIGELPGLFLLHKKNKIEWKLALFLIIPNLIGAILAGIFIVSLSKDLVEIVLGILLLIASLIYIFNKNIGIKDRKSKVPFVLRNMIGFFGTITISFLGTITGGLGPLYGSFYIWLYGKSYIGSSALWRTSSYLGNLGGATIFIINGIIDWKIFISLALGFLFGSYFGTKYGLKKGEAWIRYLIILVALTASIKLLFF